jgi:hypothetical protein
MKEGHTTLDSCGGSSFWSRILESLPFREHALVQNARNENAVRLGA